MYLPRKAQKTKDTECIWMITQWAVFFCFQMSGELTKNIYFDCTLSQLLHTWNSQPHRSEAHETVLAQIHLVSQMSQFCSVQSFLEEQHFGACDTFSREWITRQTPVWQSWSLFMVGISSIKYTSFFHWEITATFLFSTSDGF